jgi:hypothetical protein
MNIELNKLKPNDLKAVCNEKFGICKKFNNYCKPQFNEKISNDIFNDKKISNETLCIYSLDKKYDILSYCNELYTNIIFDKTDKNVYISNIIIEPVGCDIKFYIVDNIYILFDILRFDNNDISNLPYIERYKYLNKLVITGCTYEIIDLVKISELKYYVNYYIQKLPFFKHIRYINFINKNNIYPNLFYKIKSSDYKINKNITEYEFYYTIENNSKLKLYIQDIYDNNKVIFYEYGKLINKYNLTLKNLMSNEIKIENKIICKLINNIWTY